MLGYFRKPAKEADKAVPLFVSRLNKAIHISVFLVSLSLAIAVFDNTLFSWHPVFMSLGFILFMTEGVVASIMFRSLEGLDRVKAIQSHGLIQLRAILCIAVGFGVIFRNKQIHGKSHFHSLHAKVGLAALVLSLASPLFGLLSFRKMGLIQKFPEHWQPRIKMVHRQLGVVTWLVALVAIELALTHPAVKKDGLTPFWQGGVGVIGLLVLILSWKARAQAKEVDVLSKAV